MLTSALPCIATQYQNQEYYNLNHPYHINLKNLHSYEMICREHKCPVILVVLPSFMYFYCMQNLF